MSHRNMAYILITALLLVPSVSFASWILPADKEKGCPSGFISVTVQVNGEIENACLPSYETPKVEKPVPAQDTPLEGPHFDGAI